MIEIDRMAIVLKPTQLFLDWVNSQAEEEGLSEEELAGQGSVILVPVFEEEEDLLQYFNGCYSSLFEQQCSQWSMDEDTWPKLRNYQDFIHYFAIEVHDLVVDMVVSDYDDMEMVTLQ